MYSRRRGARISAGNIYLVPILAVVFPLWMMFKLISLVLSDKPKRRRRKPRKATSRSSTLTTH